MNPIVWSAPRGAFSASVPAGDGGAKLAVAPSFVVHPGQDLHLAVEALCGTRVEMVIGTRVAASVSQLARQAQVAATIQHVERRACGRCMERIFSMLTSAEKKYLYAEDPKLGPVLGIGMTAETGIIDGGKGPLG